MYIFSAAAKEGKEKDKEKGKGREKWIWDYFHHLGYVTMLSSEDCAYEGSIKTIVPKHSSINVNEGMSRVE